MPSEAETGDDSLTHHTALGQAAADEPVTIPGGDSERGAEGDTTADDEEDDEEDPAP